MVGPGGDHSNSHTQKGQRKTCAIRFVKHYQQILASLSLTTHTHTIDTSTDSPSLSLNIESLSHTHAYTLSLHNPSPPPLSLHIFSNYWPVNEIAMCVKLPLSDFLKKLSFHFAQAIQVKCATMPCGEVSGQHT